MRFCLFFFGARKAFGLQRFFLALEIRIPNRLPICFSSGRFVFW